MAILCKCLTIPKRSWWTRYINWGYDWTIASPEQHRQALKFFVEQKVVRGIRIDLPPVDDRILLKEVRTMVQPVRWAPPPSRFLGILPNNYLSNPDKAIEAINKYLEYFPDVGPNRLQIELGNEPDNFLSLSPDDYVASIIPILEYLRSKYFKSKTDTTPSSYEPIFYIAPGMGNNIGISWTEEVFNKLLLWYWSRFGGYNDFPRIVGISLHWYDANVAKFLGAVHRFQSHNFKVLVSETGSRRNSAYHLKRARGLYDLLQHKVPFFWYTMWLPQSDLLREFACFTNSNESPEVAGWLKSRNQIGRMLIRGMKS